MCLKGADVTCEGLWWLFFIMAVQGVYHHQGRIQACMVLMLCLSAAASSEKDRSYYDTLSVEPTAADGQIKKAFRKLALKYHPDKSKSADAEKTFREIVEAYSVLSNKEKRRLYDSLGHEMFLENQVFTDAEDDTNEHFSFSDFFHDFNGSPFGEEEPQFSWTFPQDWEDGPFEHPSFEGPAGFNFLFEDVDENEEDEYYYVI
ncbi:dnaJ homolog subfamily B member 9 [Hippoglossus hippoglossus]|uniref:dnaJ homolog subfamily B member 9 n=1 Tax=Hippoglossus hippoglossus TaxID=8267 RepID=UPI00148DE9DA|nr:dnaJ homolog subfamily B member 9 [Hippoglossus hippoglossus]